MAKWVVYSALDQGTQELMACCDRSPAYLNPQNSIRSCSGPLTTGSALFIAQLIC